MAQVSLTAFVGLYGLMRRVGPRFDDTNLPGGEG